MKRRSQKHKSEKMRKEAYEQLCKTREALEKQHPGLLKKIRKAAEKAENQPEEAEIDTAPGQDVPLDRKKNLEVILKYASLKPDADLKALQKDLKNFLN